MNVVSMQTPPDHASIRDAFGRAAYAGELPRERWTEAQGLVARYDDAPDDAGRASAARAMLDLAALRDSAVREIRAAA